jgi:hypothetical protein
MVTDLAYTPDVLRNKGVPCRFGDKTLHVRFTNSVLCAIEEKWGSITAWSEAQTAQPTHHARDTFAVMFEIDPADVLKLMDVEPIAHYTNALQVAWTLSSGVDPTLAADLFEAQEALTRKSHEELIADAKSLTGTPGKRGSKPG